MSAKPFRRKDLKHDEFIDATGRATQWLMGHRRRIGWALLAIVLVVSVVLSVRLVHQRQEESAAELLAAAMEIYRAPVIPAAPEAVVTPIADGGETVAADEASAQATEGDPEVAAASAEAAATGSAEASEEDPSVAGEGAAEEPLPVPEPLFTGLQFASEEEKYRAALERFEPIVARYPSRPSGRVAAFYVGDCQSRLGNTEAAIAAFTQAAEADGSLVSSMALYRLGQLERDLGNAEGAVAYFDRLLESPRSLFPRAEALMAKAGAHEEAGDQRAALAAYQRVLDDFGDSYVALEARRHVEELSARLGLDPNIEGD